MSMEMHSMMWLLVVGSLYLPFIKSVVSVGALLLVSAFMCTLIIGWGMGSWYGFILFLVYITGLLVLFGYMLAMSSNDKFSDVKRVSWASGVLATSLVVWQMYGWEVVVAVEAQSDFHEMAVGVYSGYTVVVYWFFALVLFMALIMVVAMCYKSPKPLRGFVG